MARTSKVGKGRGAMSRTPWTLGVTSDFSCIPCNRHAEGFKIYVFFTPRNLKFYASQSQKAKRK
jgi:hypothetical protein